VSAPPQPIPPVPAAAAAVAAPPSPPPPNSTFTAGALTLNQKTGELILTETVADPGTFSWLATFQNGKFGVYAASSSKCKAGFVRLGGKCRPSKIVFAKGRLAASSPGTVTLKLRPTASGLKALKAALKQKKGVPVSVALTFQSARGGSPVSQTKTVTVKLKKR
jgi:hypothetical protein